MCKSIHNGELCRKLVTFLFWLWNFSSVGILTSIGVSASNLPNVVRKAREINLEIQGTTSKPQSSGTDDNEDFPLWIIVLIVVTGGFFLVACILCLIKLYRRKRDQGTYSMWNSQGPSLEAMFARESGVLFEKIDIETCLADAKCYEIPVDSFETPQRIYIDGVRVTPLSDTLETPVSQRSLFQTAADVNIVDQTQYCAATKRGSVSTDGQRESITSSVGPGMSQQSSMSTITVSDKGTPSQETSKKVYAKPLPVVPVEDTPPSVLCQTYTLGADTNTDRVGAIVNRPLPQTPPQVFHPPGKYSAASLDRSLLKKQKEAELDKTSTFRTLPRPRKIRQIPLPFFNAISRSASSSDVSKETERLSDHVASDPKKCTLTRIKKRMSQSLDTLIASERVSHFYENPYLVEGATPAAEADPSGTHLEPPYSRVSSVPATSDEHLPKDKEHFYTRISQFMDGQENRLNRHSYASIRNPSFRARPKSKHVYISIIFGSADSVCIPSVENPDPKQRTKTLSKSLPNLTSSDEHQDIRYTPRPNSYYPPTESSGGLYSIDNQNVRTDGSRYQNIKESLGISPLEKPVPQVEANPSNGYQNLKESLGTSRSSSDIYDIAKNPDLRPYYENITSLRDHTINKQDNESDTSHYGVPKSPPIPLNRFCEILKTTGNGTSSQKSDDVNPLSKDDGSLEIWRRKRDAAGERVENGAQRDERETLSTYLEGRFNGDQLNETESIDRTVSESEACTHQNDEHTYENFISTHRDIDVSEESLSTNDRVSLSSSLSLDENQPLIPKTSDVNGNSVCEGFVEKLEVGKKALVESTSFGESIA